MTTIIVTAIVALVIVVAGYLVSRHLLDGKYRDMMEKAQKEADVIKEKKLLEVKEKFLNKKSELEKEVQQRNQKIQQSENKLKQRELQLNQRQEELGRRKQENDQAQQRIEKGDRERASFYNFYSSRRWGAAATYHLCINSSVLGIERTAEFVRTFVESKLALND